MPEYIKTGSCGDAVRLAEGAIARVKMAGAEGGEDAERERLVVGGLAFVVVRVGWDLKDEEIAARLAMLRALLPSRVLPSTTPSNGLIPPPPSAWTLDEEGPAEQIHDSAGGGRGGGQQVPLLTTYDL